MKIYYKILIFIVNCCLFSACSISKYIPEDERLYTGASLEIESDSTINNENKLRLELEKVLGPEPNSKFLGMYPGLYFHYKNQKEKPGFINRFLYKKLGEEPVYQSDVKPFEIEELLRNRLENRGFFYSSANSEFIEKDKRASIKYKVEVPTPYRMETYTLDTLPMPIYADVQEIKDETQFSKGVRFDLTNMKLERERIDFNLKQKGYFNFNESFLIFEADTNQYKKKKFDLFLKLKKDVPSRGIVPYKILKVNIYPNYSIDADSSVVPIERYEEKNYIQEELFFKPIYLDPFVTLEEGQYYDTKKSRNTARRLSTIGSYKYVNIKYKEIDSLLTDSLGMLEADIYLSPLNKRAIRAELQAVTKSNNFAGPALALTFSNRNLFKGGETLNITAKVAYETQVASGDNAGLSSLELGLDTDLIFPRMIFPIDINEEFFEYAIPKTRASLGFSYLNRTKLYSLLSGNVLFGYSWEANRYITHQVNPISLAYTRLTDTTTEFEDILNDNPFLRRSFEQQFISGLTYSFTYNGMVDSFKRHQIYFNTTFDIAGNMVSLFGKENPSINTTNTESTPKTFLGLEYAQYAKADIDVHYHLKLNKSQLIATRLFAGYGYAYGNSEVLPFVKQYFSGGPYSIRAFRIRSLGPGSYNEELNPNGSFFDQSGNIRLEANAEYRFPIFQYLNGALFVDAGNVWNSKENESLPGGKFSGNFLSELGMGTGFGIRVDIQGFVIRLDWAVPFHDPSEQNFDFDVEQSVLNFAIGYPF